MKLGSSPLLRGEGAHPSLSETLEHAIRAPYYRRVFGDRWKRIRTIADLPKLPRLDKLTAIKHQRQLVVGKPPVGFGVASSGTTRADVDLPILNVWRVEDYETGGFADPDGDPSPGWVLVSVAVNHGLPGPASRDELQIPWLPDRNSLSMMEAMLERPQSDGRRVTGMRISAGAIKVFTTWLLERGKDARKFGVEIIGTNSFRITPTWRRIIERTFGARVIDNYSLSELPSFATECTQCGWHHWNLPRMATEVLHLKSGKQLRTGVGRLVCTTLLPSVSVMPLIRYDTGDVVELGPKCGKTGEASLRFLGRVRRGVVTPRGGFVLAPSLVQDVLESSPLTERNDHPCVKLGIIKSREVGLPRWTATLERGVARLRFEVRFDPLVFAKQARELETTIHRALSKTMRGTKLEVTAVRSGSLAPPPDKHD